jgi:hypothetical protein
MAERADLLLVEQQERMQVLATPNPNPNPNPNLNPKS